MILIAVFAFYYANIRFFYHSHIIDGTTIVHSHIYNTANTQGATHSQSELILISALSVFLSLQASVYFLHPGIFSLLYIVLGPFSKEKVPSDPVPFACPRAPPFLAFNMR
ncbi:MAG: hypothetical protein LBD89_00960 [Tannerellaceae bacterium]|nr:hypothetical protein [Tannerellaceae bacterium]